MQVYVFIHFPQSLFHITTTGIFCYLTLFSLNSIPVSKWDGSLKTHYNNHQDSSHCLIQLCIVIFGMYLSKFSSRDETHSIVILLIHTYLFEKFIKEKYTDNF